MWPQAIKLTFVVIAESRSRLQRSGGKSQRCFLILFLAFKRRVPHSFLSDVTQKTSNHSAVYDMLNGISHMNPWWMRPRIQLVEHLARIFAGQTESGTQKCVPPANLCMTRYLPGYYESCTVICVLYAFLRDIIYLIKHFGNWMLASLQCWLQVNWTLRIKF